MNIYSFLLTLGLWIYSYGLHGARLIGRFVYSATPELEKSTGISEGQFGDYPSVVESVFVPDITSVIIGEDYNCGHEDAYRVAWLSEIYGEKEFPFNPSCPVLKSLHDECGKDLAAAVRVAEMEED